MKTLFAKTMMVTAALGALAACGGATTGNGGAMIDTPVPANISRSTINSANSAIASARALSPGVAPAIGNVSYDGAMVANVRVDGGATRNLYGRVNMRASFLPGGGLTGTISNLNLTSPNGTPEELLDGQLTISGNANGVTKAMSATANGTLTGVFGDGERGDVRLSTRMTGQVMNAAGFLVVDPDEAIAGTISGSGTGSNNLSLSGQFYGRER